MKKNFLRMTAILMLSAFILNGCGKKNENIQTAPEKQTVDQATNESELSTPDQSGNETNSEMNSEVSTQDTQNNSLAGVMNMLGKPDEEVNTLFEGGTENKTEDGSTLLGRSYTTTLNGKKVTLETVYSENQLVAAVSVSFAEQTPEEVKAIMTEAFGEPVVTDGTQELDSKYLTWTKNQYSITMNESYGMSNVEFTLINE